MLKPWKSIGVDRPDLRFGVELFNVTKAVADSQFGVFKQTVASGGEVKGLVYPGGANLARREIDELTEFVKQYGAKGLVWIGVIAEPDADGFYPADALRSQVTKFLSPEELRTIVEASDAARGRSDPDRRRQSCRGGPKPEQSAPGDRQASQPDRSGSSRLLLGRGFPSLGVQ